MVKVAYRSPSGLLYVDEYPQDFIKCFTRNPLNGLMVHHDPSFHSFSHFAKSIVTRVGTPPILMTESVYNGFKSARPNAIEIQNRWIYPVSIEVPGYKGTVYGVDVIYTTFQQ